MNRKIYVIVGLVFALIIVSGVLVLRDSSNYAKDFRNGLLVAQERVPRLSTEDRELALRRLGDFQERRVNHGSLEAYIGEARAYVDLGENAKARDILSAAKKVFVKEAEFYEAEGELLARMRQYRDAAKAYEKAIVLSPTRSQAYLALVDLYQNYSNASEKAELIFERAVTSGTDTREILINYASFLEVQKRDLTKALEIWTRAAEKAASEGEKQAIRLKISELGSKLGLPQE